ncbi:MAG: helix-turn-helix domain-containing protein [Chlamydiae bacterium]|nr:helix-turn-helix domain-containing protein [Chlamydiota bacterium]
MKSETIDKRSQYCMMINNRSPDSQILIRQEVVRYAQQHGNKPAARCYNCDVRTVRSWRGRFEKGGTGALKNKSRAPHHCPHKISPEAEAQIIAKRKAAPCHGPRSLKYYNPSITASQGVIATLFQA